MSDLSKPDALLHETHSKVLLVLRDQGVSRSIISLSKITQNWHLLSQRSKATKRAAGVEVGGKGVGGWQYRNVFIK